MTALAFWVVEALSVNDSLDSIMPSDVVATLTRKLFCPAGTLTVLPDKALHVTPPSTETSWVPVSVPNVAVPEAKVTLTVVALVLVLLKLIVNSKLPPSPTEGLDTLVTVKRSSSLPPVPSSLIAVVTVPVAMVALVGVLKLTVKFSLPSNTVSFVIGTVIVFVVSPGANVKLPVMAV